MDVKSQNKLARFRVGDKVQLKFGFEKMTGTIVEDRGRIGVGGRQLFRIIIETEDPDMEGEGWTLELPPEKLQAV